ncbi:metallophosphoesterase family protein [Sphingomonas sp. IC081]|uniref:metallophosphoesterase family protein n=1 Tax=Sphingomonas sp. IC081 TaxID=304378 RepID=UPI00115A8355|nr:metallophosphoesterase family protein [Sphingomonas sp. IC081]QDK31769.1 serine/threonine protein phosphatase [Sphingomonas sp. IC081]
MRRFFRPSRPAEEHHPDAPGQSAAPPASLPPPPPSADPFRDRRIPPGKRIYAIGDIHGCAAPFERLIDMIARDARGLSCRETAIVLLGDFVDRGPDSARVLDLVKLLQDSALEVHAIMGNHEEVLLELLDHPTEEVARFFARIGGRETLASYGVALPGSGDETHAIIEGVGAIPAEHRALLRGLCACAEFGDMFFTHAGIDPALALGDQDAATMRWIREPFIGSQQRFEKLVVHGHTITPAIDLAPGRVGIDTGAFRTGVLTALVLEDDRHWSLQTGIA